MDKSSLRVQYRMQVERIGEDDRHAQSMALVSKLATYLKKQIGTWTLFSPLNDEPNLLKLVNECSHLQWVFPKVESKTKMNFFAVSCLNQMVSSSWGLSEPMDDVGNVIEAKDIQGCVVPGIAYDSNGVRLGRGGGYYDRFLWNFKGLKLGVTFNEGLTNEALPREPHDQLMDFVVSPTSWIDVKNGEV